VNVGARWCYAYRAIDAHGQVVDMSVSGRRAADDAAAFVRRAIERTDSAPQAVTTDPAVGVDGA
jgi:transposase-like protein